MIESEYRHQWFCGGKEPCACMESWKAGGWKEAIANDPYELITKLKERMAKLERLVEDAEHYVSMVALPTNRGDWRPGARKWLTRYREMFPEVKQ